VHNTEKGEDYFEGGIQHCFGIKQKIKTKCLTPAPYIHHPDTCEDNLDEGIRHKTYFWDQTRNRKQVLTPRSDKQIPNPSSKCL